MTKHERHFQNALTWVRARYPHLIDLPTSITFVPRPGNEWGAFQPWSNKILVYKRVKPDAEAIYASVIAHELIHALQHAEGLLFDEREAFKVECAAYHAYRGEA